MIETKRKNEIRDNYLRVLENIENAKSRRNAGTGDVSLLCATKTVPEEEILFAVEELGLSLVGENKVQELLSKYDALKDKVPVHMIGTLQTNKVRSIVGKVAMIQSVDSLKLAKEISDRSIAAGCETDILCEVNIGREENKGGVFPEAVPAFLESVAALEGIRTRGIMTMAPVCAKNDEYKKYFEKTYSIYIDFSEKKLHNIGEWILSMGMSDSYEAAIEEGATMVRVGSSVFGKRDYTHK